MEHHGIKKNQNCKYRQQKDCLYTYKESKIAE